MSEEYVELSNLVKLVPGLFTFEKIKPEIIQYGSFSANINSLPYLGELVAVELPVDDSYENREEETLFNTYFVSPQTGGRDLVSSFLDMLIRNRDQLIFLIGDPGIGKSTFIHHCYCHELHKDRWRGYLDGRSYGILNVIKSNIPATLRANVDIQLHDILTHIQETLHLELPKILEAQMDVIHKSLGKYLRRGGRESELDEKMDSVLLDIQTRSRNFNRSFLIYLSNRTKIKIDLIIDNIDCFDLTELRAFFSSVPHMLLYKNVKLIIPLRPYTNYFMSTGEPAFQFRRAKRIQVGRPSFQEILARRFEFCPDGAINDRKVLGNRSLRDVANQGFLRAPIVELFRGIAGTDTRYYLALIERVLESPHLSDFQDYANYESILKALILNRSLLYDAVISDLFNLFDNNRTGCSQNTLIRIRLLQLVRRRQYVGVEDEQVFNLLGTLGYSEPLALRTLDDLVNKRLLVVHDAPYATGFLDDQGRVKIRGCHLRISPIGRYYLKHLCGNDTYLRLMGQVSNVRRRYLRKKSGVCVYDCIQEDISSGKLADGNKIMESYARRSTGELCVELDSFKQFVASEKEAEKDCFRGVGYVENVSLEKDYRKITEDNF